MNIYDISWSIVVFSIAVGLAVAICFALYGMYRLVTAANLIHLGDDEVIKLMDQHRERTKLFIQILAEAQELQLRYDMDNTGIEFLENILEYAEKGRTLK